MAHLKKDLKSLRKEIKDLWTMSDRQLATHESLVFAEIGAIKSDIAKRLQAWREARAIAQESKSSEKISA
jgi:hypothetical protein